MVQMNSKQMTVSELSNLSGLTTGTINYYVREGILPRPQKTSRTRATYTELHLKLIGQVKKLQKKGMPLKLIRDLFNGNLQIPRQHELGTTTISEELQNSLPKGLVTQEQFLQITGLPNQIYTELISSGILHSPRSDNGQNAYHNRRDVIAGKAIVRLIESGVTESTLFKHREFRSILRAEAHFLAEHLISANKSKTATNTTSQIVSSFDILRRYLRYLELEASYHNRFDND